MSCSVQTKHILQRIVVISSCWQFCNFSNSPVASSTRISLSCISFFYRTLLSLSLPRQTVDRHRFQDNAEKAAVFTSYQAND